MQNTPPLSVIIPVYNGERYLAEAIESVLTQTHRADEIIVIDDGSTDKTKSIVEKFGPSVRYEFQPHQNSPAARNNGLRLAGGDLIAFLDADDVWMAEKLERQLQSLSEDPTLDCVFCHVQNFLSPDLTPEEAAKYFCPPNPMPGFSLQAVLAKKELFSLVGSLNTALAFGDAVEWCQRVMNANRKHKLLEFVGVKRRIHTSNLTHTHKDQTQKDYLRLLKDSLDRKRSG